MLLFSSLPFFWLLLYQFIPPFFFFYFPFHTCRNSHFSSSFSSYLLIFLLSLLNVFSFFFFYTYSHFSATSCVLILFIPRHVYSFFLLFINAFSISHSCYSSSCHSSPFSLPPSSSSLSPSLSSSPSSSSSHFFHFIPSLIFHAVYDFYLLHVLSRFPST